MNFLKYPCFQETNNLVSDYDTSLIKGVGGKPQGKYGMHYFVHWDDEKDGGRWFECDVTRLKEG